MDRVASLPVEVSSHIFEYLIGICDVARSIYDARIWRARVKVLGLKPAAIPDAEDRILHGLTGPVPNPIPYHLVTHSSIIRSPLTISIVNEMLPLNLLRDSRYTGSLISVCEGEIRYGQLSSDLYIKMANTIGCIFRYGKSHHFRYIITMIDLFVVVCTRNPVVLYDGRAIAWTEFLSNIQYVDVDLAVTYLNSSHYTGPEDLKEILVSEGRTDITYDLGFIETNTETIVSISNFDDIELHRFLLLTQNSMIFELLETRPKILSTIIKYRDYAVLQRYIKIHGQPNTFESKSMIDKIL